MKPSHLFALLTSTLVFSIATAEPEANSAPSATPSEAQEATDPFAEAVTHSNQLSIEPTRLKRVLLPLRIRLEVWEVPAVELAKSLDHANDADAIAKLRESWLNAKEGFRLVASPVHATEPPTQANSESITERIYPTEFPAKTLSGTQTTPADGVSPGPPSLLTPSSFETRNTGQTFIATASEVAFDQGALDVALRFEEVALSGKSTYGLPAFHVEMPEFTCFTCVGTFRLKQGDWRLVSSAAAPLGASKTPTGKQWVSLVRIDRVP